MKRVFTGAILSSRMVGESALQDVLMELVTKSHKIQLELDNVKGYQNDFQITNQQVVIIPSSEHSPSYVEERHYVFYSFSTLIPGHESNSSK